VFVIFGVLCSCRKDRTDQYLPSSLSCFYLQTILLWDGRLRRKLRLGFADDNIYLQFLSTVNCMSVSILSNWTLNRYIRNKLGYVPIHLVFVLYFFVFTFARKINLHILAEEELNTPFVLMIAIRSTSPCFEQTKT